MPGRPARSSAQAAWLAPVAPFRRIRSFLSAAQAKRSLGSSWTRLASGFKATGHLVELVGFAGVPLHLYYLDKRTILRIEEKSSTYANSLALPAATFRIAKELPVFGSIEYWRRKLPPMVNSTISLGCVGST